MSDIVALRTHLFDTLDALKDKNRPMEIERAKAISDVAQTIINSAKVEVDYLRLTGGKGSGFVSATDDNGVPKVTNTPTGTKIQAGGKTTHLLK